MLHDLRHAVRVLVGGRGWTLVIVVSLALGIGAVTALFSAVSQLYLSPLPVADPHRLVRLQWAGDNEMLQSHSEYGYSGETVDGEPVFSAFSYPMFERLQASAETLSGLFACVPFGSVSVVVSGRAELAAGFLSTGGYFDVLGVSPLVGRGLTPDDDQPSASPVGVISHRFWDRRFGRDPNVVDG